MKNRSSEEETEVVKKYEKRKIIFSDKNLKQKKGNLEK